MNTVTELRLSDIASAAVLTVTPETAIEVAIQRFAEKQISCLVVEENGKPVGIVTERDLVNLICAGVPDGGVVGSIMSHPLLTARFDLDFAAAQLLMSNRGIRHLVLVDENGSMTGVASETDFRQHIGVAQFEAIHNLAAIMDQRVELVLPEQSLISALKVMSSRWLDYIIIGRDGVAEGILTERDVPRLLVQQINPQQVTVGQVMSQPLSKISADLPVVEAARCMEQSKLRHLVVLDANGDFVGVLSQHRMIERLGAMLMEESRSQLASRLGVILEATGVGPWEYDHQREVLIRSTALNNLLRFPPSDAYEKLDAVLSRVHPDERALVGSAFRQLLSGEDTQLAVDYRIVGGDGEARWITSRGRVVECDAAGRSIRSVGVAIDINAQKTAEMALRASEARFRALIEKVSLPVSYINAQRDVLFVNQQFVQTFGYTLADVPTVDAWNERAYPDEAYRAWVVASWNDAAAKVFGTEQAIRPSERRVVCKNGEIKTVEISGVVLSGRLLATLVDVTERQQEQALLEFGNATLHQVSTGRPLADVLNFIAHQIEFLESGVRCSVLLLDDAGKHLKHGAAPSLPAAYLRGIDGVEIGPVVGSCGTAAYLNKTIFVGDIATDPLWAVYKELALAHGLAACWSSPILSAAGKVLGTFAVYWPTPILAVKVMTQRYVEQATSLAAIAIEGVLRDRALREVNDELRRWQQITLGREGRVLELKREINALLIRHGEAPRYDSTLEGGGAL